VIRVVLIGLGLALASSSCMPVQLAATDEEAIGPFPSWANAQADYGAVGDGQADDTAALQKALDDLRKEDAPRKVLWLPAGTYRITRTLELLRAGHNESTGVSILGEDPRTTIIRWDGSPDGVMFLYNPWYARMGRLAFDGAGKALTALRHGEAFTTFNELSDLAFRDVAFGIEAGMKNGIAETAVYRCKFLRCSKAGISIQNFNSLDWWIWNCEFSDCAVGVTNRYGAGHFHVYNSVFLRSAEADMSIGNTQYFSIRNNTSVGSKAFFVAGPQGAGAQITFQGNTTDSPITIGNRGPVLLLDNTFLLDAGPAVKLAEHTHAVSVGNTFLRHDAVRHGERFRALDDRVARREKVPQRFLDLPEPLPRKARPVIEVAAGADAAAIQKAITNAARLNGQRPIVHLPAGKYRIGTTLTIPARCDVQLVGDGVLNATSLEWAGKGSGPVVLLQGPSRATLREMNVNGGKEADGIVVAGCDQQGGRVFLEQVLASSSEVGLLVQGLARANVVARDFGHGSNKGVGVRVVGTGQPPADGGKVLIFSGASSNNGLSYDVSKHGWLLVRDMWYESGNEPRFIRCTDSGTFTLHNAVVAHNRRKDAPGIELEGFRGKLSFLGCCFTGEPETLPAIVLKGEGKETQFLALGSHGNGEYYANESAGARAARLYSVQYTPGGGSKPIDDVGEWNDGFVREMLEQTRLHNPAPLARTPLGATDARLFRLTVNGRTAVVVRP